MDENILKSFKEYSTIKQKEYSFLYDKKLLTPHNP